ncbi:hypothetical protein QR680_014386 [Steinernema hermaphroditum]|uniref:Uncharacterized protein n=1 Tax=Steinernema hermaphroditum TaxID=289476 RepID=A0AA39I8P9_9BILA|nr:hypothetical protein QR680_014386 [Steinernema hermaphroditum]
MDHVPADFIERTLFLIENLPSLSKFPSRSRFRRFEEAQRKKECSLECVMTVDCVFRAELKHTKFLRDVCIYLMTEEGRGARVVDQNHLKSLCRRAREVTVMSTIFNPFDSSAMFKKMLDLDVPIHNLSLLSDTPLGDKLFRTAITKSLLRNVSVCDLSNLKADHLVNLFCQPQLEKLVYIEEFDTERYKIRTQSLWEEVFKWWKDQKTAVQKLLHCCVMPPLEFREFSDAKEASLTMDCDKITKIDDFELPQRFKGELNNNLWEPGCQIYVIPHPAIPNHVACIAFGIGMSDEYPPEFDRKYRNYCKRTQEKGEMLLSLEDYVRTRIRRAGRHRFAERADEAFFMFFSK